MGNIIVCFKTLVLCMEVAKFHGQISDNELKARMEEIDDIRDMNETVSMKEW